MKDRVALMLAAFWWGSLTTIGFLVVPMLFARLGNPSVAGNLPASCSRRRAGSRLPAG
jgi:hypothetical protein